MIADVTRATPISARITSRHLLGHLQNWSFKVILIFYSKKDSSMINCESRWNFILVSIFKWEIAITKKWHNSRKQENNLNQKDSIFLIPPIKIFNFQEMLLICFPHRLLILHLCLPSKFPANLWLELCFLCYKISTFVLSNQSLTSLCSRFLAML